MPEKYTPPDAEEIFQRMQKLFEVFKDFWRAMGFESSSIQNEIHFNIVDFEDLLVRVDKRKSYYRFYHDNMRLFAAKRAALIAYWILKFKPITHKCNERKKVLGSINEAFAWYLIMGAVNEVLLREQEKELRLPEQYIINVIYSFKYWDLSKESLMLIAETLCAAAETL